MPFVTIEPGVAIGSVESENAIRLSDGGGPQFTFVESENGSVVLVHEIFRSFILTATQVNALGRFCVRQFMCGEPAELLSRIELSAKGVALSLEAWNERARIDEEHPPYDRLVAELELIKGALDELRKGLTP